MKWIWFFVGAIWILGCGDGGKNPVVESQTRVVAGVDFAVLFAPPTAAEIAQVEAEWAQRQVAAEDVAEVLSTPLVLGTTPYTLRVVSHRVDEATHFGAILAPDNAAAGSRPVLIYGHGSDGGVDISEVLLVSLGFGRLRDQAVYVIPSFRAQSLRFDGQAFRSTGQPSPWDRDVDDALALLEVALQTTPAADPGRIGALGFSSGAGVAMLMAVRDSRIRAVVDYFGPTNFYGPFLQDLVAEALEGRPRDLPYIDYLSANTILPLTTGGLTLPQLRLELLRRSVVYFAARLPALQAHHGTEDDTIPVSQTETLIAAMESLGRTPPAFEAFLYEGGGHHPLTIPESLPQVEVFFDRLLDGDI